MSTNKYTTLSDAARRLKLSYERVRTLVFTGQLKAQQVPRGVSWGRWLVDTQDLARLVRQREATRP